MDKLKYIKLENEDGSYTDSIPLAVDSDYVDVNGGTLTEVINLKANTASVNASINNLQLEINSLASGSPAGTFTTVAALTAADPDHSKIYIVTSDGHWYYYNNGWQDGGVYQATDNNDLVEANRESINELSKQIGSVIHGGEYNLSYLDCFYEEGHYYSPSGVYTTLAGYGYFLVDILKANKITIDTTLCSSESTLVLLDTNLAYKGNISSGWPVQGTYVYNIESDSIAYVAISVKTNDLNKVIVTVERDGVYENFDESIESLENIKLNKTDFFGGEELDREKIEELDWGSGWYNSSGIYQSGAGYNYTYIDIHDAEGFILDTRNCVDTIVLNFCDKNKTFISNKLNWTARNIWTIYDIPNGTYYLLLSGMPVDNSKIIIKKIKDNFYENAINKDKDTFLYSSSYAYTKTDNNDQFLKGLFVDAGRKYFNVNNLKTLIDTAYEAGLNTFLLYFSDSEGFRFGLDDMNINVFDDTYDLSVCLGDGYAPTDGTNKWLTQSEMDEIIAYVYSKNMNFIPAFDMPGHFGAISRHFSDAKFNIKNNYGIMFRLSILRKYADYFQSKGCKYYNICGDEVGNMSSADYENFMRKAHKELILRNMTPLMYNDMICQDGDYSPMIDTGCIVLGWIRRNQMAAYKQINACGYRMINSAAKYYWVLGSKETTPELVEQIRNSDIFTMADGSKMYNIKGVFYHIWCDKANQDGPDEGDHIVETVPPCIEAFGEAISRKVPGNSFHYFSASDGKTYTWDVENGNLIAKEV